MATTSAAATPDSVRPTQVTYAVILRIATTILSFFTPLLPGMGDTPTEAFVITGVMSAVMLLGTWGLWNLRRWGAILTFVLTVLSVLSTIPASTEYSGGWFIAAVLFFTPLELAVLVLIAHPAARRAYRR